MAEAFAVMSTLDTLAKEVDSRSSELAKTERDLEPVEIEYEDFYEDFVAGMFEDQEGGRLPGEDVRRAVCHKYLKARKPELLGRYRELVRRRKRLEKRIQSLKVAVDAQRSILSALKVELEATGASLR